MRRATMTATARRRPGSALALRVPCRRVAAAAVFAAAVAVLFGLMHPAAAAPQRGGTLEFAVGVEPKNYDCTSNTSFAFLHPIAPHYSTLLKFDAAQYPKIV